ncbi:hypothetical protein EON65_42440 [archaeon]|nr:MAG: hypothetical protein EON65_42440 [archaeon]
MARKPVQPASGPLSTTSAAVDVLKIDEAPYPTTKKKRTDKKLPKDGHFYCKPTDVLNSTYTTNACKFTVFGEPIALSRHRVTRGGIMYNPSAKFQADFLLACSSYLPPTPLEGSIAVNMVFYFSRPKNHYGTGKNANVLKNTADVWHAKRSG